MPKFQPSHSDYWLAVARDLRAGEYSEGDIEDAANFIEHVVESWKLLGDLDS